jgi:hypothetical protein
MNPQVVFVAALQRDCCLAARLLLRGDSPNYCERYADNLSKELPRIPRAKKPTDFWSFSRADRDLDELHIGYEKVKPSWDRSGTKNSKDFEVDCGIFTGSAAPTDSLCS